MKLWRRTGHRALSGRLYGQGRQQVYPKMPSRLILALIQRTQPKEVKMNETYVHPMLANPLNAVGPITLR